jgi:hypothetical protein
MNDLPQENLSEIPPDPWEVWSLVEPRGHRQGVDRRFAFGDSFLAIVSDEKEAAVQVDHGEFETTVLTDQLEWASEGREKVADEAPRGTWSENPAAFDLYVGIRPALSPDYATRSTEEITAALGTRPAILALYGLLARPEPQRAALAVLLGKAGRRLLPLNGSQIPIATYLRQLARLFRNAAQHCEAEFGADMAPARIEVEFENPPPGQAAHVITPVLQLDRIQVGQISAPLTSNASGGFQAFFGLGALPSPMASATITGRVLVDEDGKRRPFTKSDRHAAWTPKEIVNVVYASRSPGTSSSSSSLVQAKEDGTFVTESTLGLDEGATRIHILVKSSLKDGRDISADALLQRNDLEVFLSIVDKYERASTNTLTHLEFLSSVRKMFQPPPKSSLAGFFDRLLYRNHKITRLVDFTTADGQLIRRFENMEISSQLVDIGHVLTGIEGSRKQQPLLGSPGIGPWHWHIMFDEDLEATVTWAGDFGLALASYVEAMVAGKTVDIRTFLTAHAGLPDLLGDIDSINIGANYDGSQSLSNNLRTYYTTQPFRRFSSFVNNATDGQGKPLFPVIPGQPKLAASGRERFAFYVLLFAGRKLTYASSITPQQLGTVSKIVMPGSKAAEIGVITDYFFAFIEDGLAKEFST